MVEIDLKVSIYSLMVCGVVSAVSQLNGRKRAKGSSVYPSQQLYDDLSRRPIHHLNGASVEKCITSMISSSMKRLAFNHASTTPILDTSFCHRSQPKKYSSAPNCQTCVAGGSLRIFVGLLFVLSIMDLAALQHQP